MKNLFKDCKVIEHRTNNFYKLYKDVGKIKTRKEFTIMKKKLLRVFSCFLAAAALLTCLTSCNGGEVVTKQYEDEDGNIHMAVGNTESYQKEVAFWDGNKLSFSDGTEISVEKDQVIIIEDKDGNVVDKYIGIGEDGNVPSDVVPEILPDEKDEYTAYLIYESAEVFYLNRPLWDGETLIFSLGEVPMAGATIIVKDKSGNVLCTYKGKELEAKQPEYIKGVEVVDGVTVITVTQVKEYNTDGSEYMTDPNVWFNCDPISGKVQLLDNGDPTSVDITTRRVEVRREDGTISEQVFFAPATYTDKYPEIIKRVVDKGLDTYIVISESDWYNLNTADSYGNVPYLDGWLLHDEEGHYNHETLAEWPAHLTAAVYEQYGNRVVFFDGSSLEVNGSNVYFVCDEDPEEEWEWRRKDLGRIPGKDIVDLQVMDFVNEEYYTDLIASYSEDCTPHMLVTYEGGAGTDVDFSALTIEGNVITMPCGTKITCKYDRVVFINDDGLLGEIDIGYYRNLPMESVADTTLVRTIVVLNGNDFGGYYYNESTGVTSVWVGGKEIKVEYANFGINFIIPHDKMQKNSIYIHDAGSQWTNQWYDYFVR